MASEWHAGRRVPTAKVRSGRLPLAMPVSSGAHWIEGQRSRRTSLQFPVVACNRIPLLSLHRGERRPAAHQWPQSPSRECAAELLATDALSLLCPGPSGNPLTCSQPSIAQQNKLPLEQSPRQLPVTGTYETGSQTRLANATSRGGYARHVLTVRSHPPIPPPNHSSDFRRSLPECSAEPATPRSANDGRFRPVIHAQPKTYITHESSMPAILSRCAVPSCQTQKGGQHHNGTGREPSARAKTKRTKKWRLGGSSRQSGINVSSRAAELVFLRLHADILVLFAART